MRVGEKVVVMEGMESPVNTAESLFLWQYMGGKQNTGNVYVIA